MIRKIANRSFAIRAAPRATPVKPTAPAISETTSAAMASPRSPMRGVYIVLGILLSALPALPTRAAPLDVSDQVDGHLLALWQPTGEPPPATPVPPPSEDDEASVEAQDQTSARKARRRFGLDRLVRRFSTSVNLRLTEEPYRLAIRIRYSRGVEFDFESDSYAMIEGFEISPGSELRRYERIGTVEIGPYFDLNRPMRIVVRRVGFPTWYSAFFARPYRLSRLPTTRERALLMEPGSSVTLFVGVAVFLGPRAYHRFGEAPSTATAGLVLPTDYATTVERLLRPEDGAEWVLSVSGSVRRLWEFTGRLRTPKIWVKRLRLFDARWHPGIRGVRFSYSSLPLDLRRAEEYTATYRSVMSGLTRIPDVKLFGQTFRVFLRRDIDVETLDEIQNLAEFRRVLEARSPQAVSIPWTRALTGLRGREADLRFWIFLYRTSWSFDHFDEETVVDLHDRFPQKLFDYVTRRERTRGWLFFPREGYELEMTTVQDFVTGEPYTEAILEIHDRDTRRGEHLRYRQIARRFLSDTLLARFPLEPQPRGELENGALAIDGRPDLDHVPPYRENASFVLRLILGPTLHPAVEWPTAPADARVRRVRSRQARSLHEVIHDTIFHGREGVDDLLRTAGAGDVYASFRIELQPTRKALRAQHVRRIYRGSTGQPSDVRGYTRLRRLLETAGSLF